MKITKAKKTKLKAYIEEHADMLIKKDNGINDATINMVKHHILSLVESDNPAAITAVLEQMDTNNENS